MAELLKPGTAYCPVCQDELRDGQNVQDAYLPINPQKTVAVPVHEWCGTRISFSPDALSRTIERLKADWELGNQILNRAARRNSARRQDGRGR